jgi:hypothetical protein
MTGTRLGIICETIATFIVAIILGFIFNWRLALIVLLPVLFIVIILYINIVFKTKIAEIWGQKIEKASMVRLNYFSLSIEDKILSY